MTPTRILLNAYYEALYEILTQNRAFCSKRIGDVLKKELERYGDADDQQERYDALYEACEAFVTERLEMYNPIGVQYLFSMGDPQDAFELELELNWYDARNEYWELVNAARQLADQNERTEHLARKVRLLIEQAGAYPDKSIIKYYEMVPGLMKLPDYVVARVIEATLQRSPDH